jgi:hypothetical protein
MRDIRIRCLLKKESDITFEGAAINCDLGRERPGLPEEGEVVAWD